MKYPILYSFKRCPYAMRARMAILLTNTKCEIREVNLSNKPMSMIEASEKGTVPVLITINNKIYDESLDIIEWVLKRNNIFDKTHNSSESEVSDSLISQFDKDFKFHLDRYKYSSRYIKEEKSRHRDACLFILKEIELIHSKDTWFFGKEINKIDICLLPFIRQYRIADIDWFDSLDEIPVIQNWLNYFLESELLKNIMINYKPWEPNDEVEYFPYKPIDS
jgi:glutathione S-transferase